MSVKASDITVIVVVPSVIRSNARQSSSRSSAGLPLPAIQKISLSTLQIFLGFHKASLFVRGSSACRHFALGSYLKATKHVLPSFLANPYLSPTLKYWLSEFAFVTLLLWNDWNWLVSQSREAFDIVAGPFQNRH